MGYFFIVCIFMVPLSAAYAEPVYPPTSTDVGTTIKVPDPSSRWQGSINAYTLYGDYSDSDIQSVIREESVSATAFVPWERFFRLSFKRTKVKLKQEFPTVRQRQLIGRAQKFFTLADNGGHIGAKFDLYMSETANDDIDNNEIDSRIFSPGLSWIRADQKLTLGADYTYSDYRRGQHIKQWGIQLGTAFPTDSFWLQLKGFLIDPDVAFKLDGVRDTRSAELAWSYRLGKKAETFDTVIFSSVLLGERVFAVDTTTETAYSLPDVQTQSYTVGMQFETRDMLNISVSYSFDKFDARYRDNPYQRNQITLGVSDTW